VDTGFTAEHVAKNMRLRAELREARMKTYVLRKATAFFAKESR